MTEKYLLRLKDISKSFNGVKVLDTVNLNIRPGSIHALMGENGAGKSTLMKCLFGVYQQDSGEFFLYEQNFDFHDPADALNNGISMVHQELNQVLQRSVSDNIWLGRYPTKRGLIDEEKMYLDTVALFKSLNIKVDPNAILRELSVSQRQMVEIAKAVSYNAKVIVLDEPTSSLTENEVHHLFEIMRTLKNKGVSIIYISHKLEEIFEITDEVTVLRDGKWIGTSLTKDLTMDKIINMMVGRKLDQRFPELPNTIGEEKFRVDGLKTMYDPQVKEASFNLRKGEILGIGGLVGSRRTEMLEALFGLRTRSEGKIYIDGKEVMIINPIHAINAGIALVTEERRLNGIYPVSSVRFNTTIANMDKYITRIGLLNDKKMIEDTALQIKNMKVKTQTQMDLIRTLSGGNQQKIIIGRWLLKEPDIFLMDEPTRGVDVGAKFEIYNLMIELIKRGKSIIMVSSEMPELLGMTHRIAVMSNGRLVDVLDTKKATQEKIFEISAKYL